MQKEKKTKAINTHGPSISSDSATGDFGSFVPDNKMVIEIKTKLNRVMIKVHPSLLVYKYFSFPKYKFNIFMLS